VECKKEIYLNADGLHLKGLLSNQELHVNGQLVYNAFKVKNIRPEKTLV
jgi:hypothetical protein